MRIRKAAADRAGISLVAMIDVLMILLVFFMVTSTYLDLDMVPLARAPDAATDTATAGLYGGDAASSGAARMLIRLGGDGLAHVQGQALTGAELGAVLSARLAEAPDLDVIVLPSGAATVQALAALMDVAVTAGAERLRIVRLEPAP
jgi:biopolymer transport protein ExbD